MKPIAVLVSLLLILTPAAWYLLNNSRTSLEQQISVECSNCVEKQRQIQSQGGEILSLRLHLRDLSAASATERKVATRPTDSARSNESEISALANLQKQLVDEQMQNQRLRAERELLHQQLTALLNERAEGLLQRYLQSHGAGTPAHMDRIREYLSLAYRAGVSPDLVQVEKLHCAVEELLPQMERSPTAFPEGYDSTQLCWQEPQFSIIDWRHEQQVKLAALLQERVAEALAVQTTLLFPEEEE